MQHKDNAKSFIQVQFVPDQAQGLMPCKIYQKGIVDSRGAAMELAWMLYHDGLSTRGLVSPNKGLVVGQVWRCRPAVDTNGDG